MKALFYPILLLGLSQSAHSFTVTFESPVGDLSRTSGHEEITRQSIIMAQSILKADSSVADTEFLLGTHMTDLEEVLDGTSGPDALNPIIRGNYATDVPDEKSRYSTSFGSPGWEKKKKKVNNVPNSIDWHTNPDGQNIHFLRNFSGTELESAYSACMGGRKRIENASLKSLKMWANYLVQFGSAEKSATQLMQSIAQFKKAGKDTKRLEKALRDLERSIAPDRVKIQRKSLFLMGHATHVLQDSFSPAHSIRSTKGNFDIQDVCYYDPRGMGGGGGKAAIPHFDAGLKTILSKSIDKMTQMFRDIWAGQEARDDSKLVCLHNTFDIRDGIWSRTHDHKHQLQDSKWDESELLETLNHSSKKSIDACVGYDFVDGRKVSCLKHDARLARNATARYLVFMAKSADQMRQKIAENPRAREKDLFNSQAILKSLKKNVFEGNMQVSQFSLKNVMPRGILRCDNQLSKSPAQMDITKN
ncbi:MAG: hypothetical protein AB8E15_03025 [Bdellovibrionales bacterium]